MTNKISKFLKYCIKISLLKGLRLISRFKSSRIDENLLIFGAHQGEAFIGNTKYLFLYLNEFSDYECIWVSRSKEVVRELRERGFNSLYAFSFNAFAKLRKARYIFITHGMGDVLPIKVSKKTKLIFTWHGNPIKKCGFDSPTIKDNRYDRKVLDILSKEISYILVSSEDEKRKMETMYKIPLERIIVTGYTRHDFLCNRTDEEINIFKESLGIPKDIKNIILYGPTFREEKIAKMPFSKTNMIELDNFLKESNSILIFKAHPGVNEIATIDLDNIIIPDSYLDPQELLLAADVLIFDYSSIMFEFLLTGNKPVISFPYDLEFYKKERGLYYDYLKFIPAPIVYNIPDLIYHLKTIKNWSPKYEERRRNVCKLVNTFNDGNSSKRVAEFLDLKLNI
jgi:CDP-glycerol glycerophosphotransferase (TagB/SpsB family)